MNLQLVTGASWGRGKGLEDLKPSSKMGDPFHESRPAHGPLPRALPRSGGLLETSAFGEVVGQQLRLRFGDGGKALLEYLGDPPVELLARALQERLVGDRVRERMLERVLEIGEQAAS